MNTAGSVKGDDVLALGVSGTLRLRTLWRCRFFFSSEINTPFGRSSNEQKQLEKVKGSFFPSIDDNTIRCKEGSAQFSSLVI